MKIYTITLAVVTGLLFAQCKKGAITKTPDPKTSFLEQAQQFVKQKTPQADYEQLDWKRASVYQQNGVNQLVRVPLLGNKEPSQKAVYVTYANGHFSGNYFELTDHVVITLSLDNVRKCVAPLETDRSVKNYRIYENGRLIQEHTDTEKIRPVRPPAYFTDFNFHMYYLTVMLGLGQEGIGGDLTTTPQGTISYLEAIPDGGELGQGGGGGAPGEIIEIDYYDGESRTAVDIAKMFNCFDQVPDFPGTTYEITLHADVPVNALPTKPMDIWLSPGHVFLSITKTHPSKSVTQNFGFYPVSGFQSLGLGNVTSVIKNDAFHESNAQIKIPITQYDFNLIRANAIYEASLPYNLQTNNCADFALKLFNLARPNNPIILPIFMTYIFTGSGLIPGVALNNSPQALFGLLELKQLNNSPDAPFIQIDRSKNTKSGASSGECN